MHAPRARQNEATRWATRTNELSLSLFCAGIEPAQNRKREIIGMGRFPRATVSATSALGYYRFAPPGREAEPAAAEVNDLFRLLTSAATILMLWQKSAL